MQFARSLPAVLALLGLVGCGPAPHPHVESEPLVKMLSAYIAATQANKRPPKDEDELRKHLPPEDAGLLFVSPRDHKLYIVRYGINVRDPKLNPADPPVIAYEQIGKGGVRHAATAMGLTQLTDEQFQKLPKE